MRYIVPLIISLSLAPGVILMFLGTGTSTGYEIALWVVGALVIVFSTIKTVEWFLVLAGVIKSPEQKLKDALHALYTDDSKKITDLHNILTDKVFAKEQEGRFDDIAEIRQEISRVFPWLKTPPEVQTPPFWCKSADNIVKLSGIEVGILDLLRQEGERDKQLDLIIKLLQSILSRRDNGVKDSN